MDSFGSKLRAKRLEWQLSLKEVEERSARLAQDWGRPTYKISASWLHRVETDNRELSATKLIVLASIYNLSANDLLALSPESGAVPAMLDHASAPNATLFLPGGPLEEHARQWLPDRLMLGPIPEQTSLLRLETEKLPANYRRAVVGLNDHYLAPMVMAGSYLLIDTSQRVILSRREWSNEFDRPIYFLLTRNGYMCGFCELDRDAEWLTLLPHPLSFASTRRWRYKTEVEVIGTVAAYTVKRRPS